MKVAYVMTQSQDIGGASVHIIDLASAMQAAGHQVVVLVGGNGIFHERALHHGLRTLALRHLQRVIHPWHDLCAIIELARCLRREEPDLVHLHSTKAGIVGRLSARLLGLPVVFTAHGWAFTEGVPACRATLYRLVEKGMAPLARRIITVSDYDRNLALRFGVGRPEQLVTVHNGMPDIPMPSRVARSDVLEIIMVARMDPPKDQQALLRALHDLRDLPWRLTLVGDGSLRMALEQQAVGLGIAERIAWPGECHDVPERLARAEIFVLTSQWEGLPLSIIEAMRAGLPVVASDVGGVAELVVENKTGLLARQGDIDGLAKQLRELLLSEPLRRRLGEAGRVRYQQAFTFDATFRETMVIYRQAVVSA